MLVPTKRPKIVMFQVKKVFRGRVTVYKESNKKQGQALQVKVDACVIMLLLERDGEGLPFITDAIVI